MSNTFKSVTIFPYAVFEKMISSDNTASSSWALIIVFVQKQIHNNKTS